MRDPGCFLKLNESHRILHRDATKMDSQTQVGRRFSTAQLGLLIFCASFLIYMVSPQGHPSFTDLKHGAEVMRVSLSLAHTGDFSDPFFSLPTGPTAHPAPAYVFVYAAVARLFGEGLAGARILWALNIGFLALQLALLPVLSKRLGLGVLPGVLAAAFGALFQPYRVLPEWESLFVGALLVLLCVLTIPYFKSPRSWEFSALLGFLWGIAILACPQSVLLLFAWAHISAMENSPTQLAKARRAMAVVVAAAALACLPWFIRNFQRFHTVFFVRDNLGLELATSNNPCAGPTVLANFISGCHLRTHPGDNVGLALEVIDKGEIRFNQDRMHLALTWISSNPRAFVSLTAKRFLKFWFPYLAGYRYGIPSGILTVISFAGLVVMFRRNRTAAWLLASTLLLYPLINYVIQFEARYRYPIFWATFLPAAYALVEFARWVRRRWVRRPPEQLEIAGEERNDLVPVLK